MHAFKTSWQCHPCSCMVLVQVWYIHKTSKYFKDMPYIYAKKGKKYKLIVYLNVYYASTCIKIQNV